MNELAPDVSLTGSLNLSSCLLESESPQGNHDFDFGLYQRNSLGQRSNSSAMKDTLISQN